MQAAIIKRFGPAVLHHAFYAAATSGCAAVLTWRIVLRLLKRSALPAKLVAGMLAAPLVFLGTAAIFPHPFYDADCTLAILFCMWLLLRIEARGWPARATFATGMLLAIPLFVKQNTGLAFLVTAEACIGWLLLRAINIGDRNARRAFAVLLFGTATGLCLALAVLHITCGLANYYQWTIRFAASRRLPGVSAILGVYLDPALIWSFAAFAAGIALFLRGRFRAVQSRRHSAARWSGCVLLSLPFLWTVAALLVRADDSERAEALLHLWPVLLAASLAFALTRLPHAASFSELVPLLLLGTIHGAFLSQQLWGSTYALWPLLIILIACIVAAIAPSDSAEESSGSSSAPLLTFIVVVSLTLLIGGGNYAISHERLSYADLSGDVLHHSALPPLRGLAMRGDWLPDFEELVAFTNREIPAHDAILEIPGEDLFYFTTGRTPQFPVIMLDNTVNPYSAEQLAMLARQHDVRWVIVKRKLQLGEEPIAFRARLMQLVARDYEKIETLNNYEIFRRR